MTLLALAAALWIPSSAGLALILGRAIRKADERERPNRHPAEPTYVPQEWTA